jgi:hypothetical protein
MSIARSKSDQTPVCIHKRFVECFFQAPIRAIDVIAIASTRLTSQIRIH